MALMARDHGWWCVLVILSSLLQVCWATSDPSAHSVLSEQDLRMAREYLTTEHLNERGKRRRLVPAKEMDQVLDGVKYYLTPVEHNGQTQPRVFDILHHPPWTGKHADLASQTAQYLVLNQPGRVRAFDRAHRHPTLPHRANAESALRRPFEDADFQARQHQRKKEQEESERRRSQREFEQKKTQETHDDSDKPHHDHHQAGRNIEQNAKQFLGISKLESPRSPSSDSGSSQLSGKTSYKSLSSDTASFKSAEDHEAPRSKKAFEPSYRPLANGDLRAFLHHVDPAYATDLRVARVQGQPDPIPYPRWWIQRQASLTRARAQMRQTPFSPFNAMTPGPSSNAITPQPLSNAITSNPSSNARPSSNAMTPGTLSNAMQSSQAKPSSPTTMGPFNPRSEARTQLSKATSHDFLTKEQS